MSAITFWRGNRTDAKYELELEAVADAFIESRYNATEYLHHWPLERVIRAFLTSREGLNSVFDESDYEQIHEAISRRVFPNS